MPMEGPEEFEELIVPSEEAVLGCTMSLIAEKRTLLKYSTMEERT